MCAKRSRTEDGADFEGVSAEMTEMTPALWIGLGALAVVAAGVCGFLLATYLTSRRR